MHLRHCPRRQLGQQSRCRSATRQQEDELNKMVWKTLFTLALIGFAEGISLRKAHCDSVLVSLHAEQCFSLVDNTEDKSMDLLAFDSRKECRLMARVLSCLDDVAFRCPDAYTLGPMPNTNTLADLWKTYYFQCPMLK